MHNHCHYLTITQNIQHSSSMVCVIINKATTRRKSKYNIKNTLLFFLNSAKQLLACDQTQKNAKGLHNLKWIYFAYTSLFLGIQRNLQAEPKT